MKINQNNLYLTTYCESPGFMTVPHPISYEEWILTTSLKNRRVCFFLSEPSDLFSKTKNRDVFRRQENSI